VQASITDMIKAVGPESPTLLSLLADVPAGAEVLVLAFVRTLTEGGERHGTLVAAIKALYARSGDARFMIYICASLPRAELEALLPKIVALPAVRPAPFLRPAPPRRPRPPHLPPPSPPTLSPSIPAAFPAAHPALSLHPAS
jgi:hypothetical protein